MTPPAIQWETTETRRTMHKLMVVGSDGSGGDATPADLLRAGYVPRGESEAHPVALVDEWKARAATAERERDEARAALEFFRLEKGRDIGSLRAELAKVRPVVEAAKAWWAEYSPREAGKLNSTGQQLFDAITDSISASEAGERKRCASAYTHKVFRSEKEPDSVTVQCCKDAGHDGWHQDANGVQTMQWGGPGAAKADPDALGRIVSDYFGGLGGLSWEELSEKGRGQYRACGAAVAAYVRGQSATPAESPADAYAVGWIAGYGAAIDALAKADIPKPPPYEPPACQRAGEEVLGDG